MFCLNTVHVFYDGLRFYIQIKLDIPLQNIFRQTEVESTLLINKHVDNMDVELVYL